MAGYITGEAVVIDGGKRYLGGGGSQTERLLDWTDADWAEMRQKARGANS